MTEEKPSSGIWMSQGRDRLHRWINGATPGRRLSLPTMPRLWAPERRCEGRGCTHNLGSLHGNSLQGREGESGDTEGRHTMSPASAHAVGNSPRDKRRGNIPHPTLIPPKLGPSFVPAVVFCVPSWAGGQCLLAHPAALPARGVQEPSLGERLFPLPGIDPQETHVQ